MVSSVLVGVLYLGLAVVPAAVIARAWRHRQDSVGRPLLVALAGASGTALCHGLRVLTASFGGPAAIEAGLFFGLLFAVDVGTLGAFYTAAAYTGRNWLRHRWILVLVWGLALGLTTVDWLGQLAILTAITWPLTVVEIWYHVLLAVGILLMFGERFLETRGVYRRQAAVVLAGFAIAMVLSVLQRSVEVYPVNFVPLGFVIGVGLIAWSLLRYQFLEASPVARETLFEHLTDPVVAISEDGRILTVNDPAREAFGLGDVEGETVASVFGPAPDLAARYEDVLEPDGLVAAVVDDGTRHVDPDHAGIQAVLAGRDPEAAQPDIGVFTDGSLRFFHMTASAFEAEGRAGQLLIFREVTEEKERERELDLLKQVLTRVLRHNIRNDMTVIQGYASAVRENPDADAVEYADRILETSADLVETTEKARRIERVIDADDTVVLGLAEVVEAAVETVREDYPDATYAVDVPGDLRVRTNPELRTALVSVIENAVVHTGPAPSVRVTAVPDDPWVELSVSDDGPGIEAGELATFERGEETSLVHGSGAGLWLVYTVVDRSGGDISFEVDDGTTVRMRFQAARAG